MSPIYDYIGIGLGPFNLSLACLLQPLNGVDGLFIEQSSEFNWHPGLMLDDAHLQTPFMSDLVTLADPTHSLSFLNYAKQQGKLYSFYIREDFFLLRREYNQYCRWAIEQLDNVAFNTRVVQVEYSEAEACYQVTCERLQHGQVTEVQLLKARKLILGTGPKPHWPANTRASERCSHASDYLNRKAAIQKSKCITLVGGGQSAAEIYYDLLQDIHQYGYELHWLTRSPRFFPLEYSKLTLEMTSPEYVDYFHALPAEQRDELIAQQKHLYKGINQSLINDIFDLLYRLRLEKPVNTRLLTHARLEQVFESQQNLRIRCQHSELNQPFELSTEQLILATGYERQWPEFLQPIADRIRWDAQGRPDVQRNYSIDKHGNELFVQNMELNTHGFVTPDLGMACYRNSWLVREITGVEHYPIEQRIAFQDFAIPTDWQITTAPQECPA
ncbi:lysine N6-hydroxylase/L-ornithine N5-oxygenase family protein [Bacterioplanes sanyensis]|uniref:lysine N(6)-hydroxylase/L-ornithine N(5)-oxygenase family protein n=1 Tax=Bacterioplanes sanyensis TaxID=1249553 RepID=UPI00167B8607|nr:SidA/IucD/PvdA family monooxygenase [Bacterioplanes sanyensis]GGY55660.1 lysine N6-hydroxylase/L-ornithine N5-oxygenase family protein [Bacterioplanes sanyensis]